MARGTTHPGTGSAAINLHIGQRVRHRDHDGQRVTGMVRALGLEDSVLMATIVLDEPIVIPASQDWREVRIHNQHVPAHELAPFDDRDELIAELRLACEGLLSGAETGVASLGAMRAARAAIAKVTGSQP